MQVKGKRMDVDSGIRTRSRAKQQAEQWSMEPAPAKILALLADYLQEQQSQEPELPRFPGRQETEAQPVWILMGGDSPQRQASLASGMNTFMSLRHQSDIQVRLRFIGTRARMQAVTLGLSPNGQGLAHSFVVTTCCQKQS